MSEGFAILLLSGFDTGHPLVPLHTPAPSPSRWTPNAGTLEGDCKVLREPLEVALWRGDRRCGAVAVSLAGLHWRQQRRCAVPLPDGSATALTLEALDFGLPPANEDEGEELVAALPMHVVRENGLPVGQGLVCRSVRILVPWARLNGNRGNPMGWMGGGGDCHNLLFSPHTTPTPYGGAATGFDHRSLHDLYFALAPGVVPSPLGVDRLSNDLHTPLRGVPQPSSSVVPSSQAGSPTLLIFSQTACPLLTHHQPTHHQHPKVWKGLCCHRRVARKIRRARLRGR